MICQVRNTKIWFTTFIDFWNMLWILPICGCQLFKHIVYAIDQFVYTSLGIRRLLSSIIWGGKSKIDTLANNFFVYRIVYFQEYVFFLIFLLDYGAQIYILLIRQLPMPKSTALNRTPNNSDTGISRLECWACFKLHHIGIG